MTGDLEIRAKIVEWLSGMLSLEAFEDWLTQNTWNVHQWGNKEVIALVHEIELRLSEHSSGHLPEEQMAREFRRFVQYYQAPLQPTPKVSTSYGSSSAFSFHGEVHFGSGQPAGRQLS